MGEENEIEAMEHEFINASDDVLENEAEDVYFSNIVLPEMCFFDYNKQKKRNNAIKWGTL